MKTYREKYSELYQFLGGYFHPDWKECFDWKGQSPMFELVVRHYKAEEDSSMGIAKTTAELEEFLSLPLSDRELEQIVDDEFTAWYTPRSRGMSKRQFLEKILAILKEPIETISPIKRIA